MNKDFAVLEGLMFLAGDEGVEFKTIKTILGKSNDETRALIEIFKNKIDQDESRGLTVKKIDSAYKLTTKPVHKEFYSMLVEAKDSQTKLSQSAVETLAIIAYKQPITRVEIEDIRGVSTDTMLRKLIAKDLIEELGRTEGPGKPVLFGVTKTFMDHFGLESLKELPEVAIQASMDLEEQNIYDTRFTENNVGRT